MRKYLIAGTAALIFTTGAALADSVTVVSPSPVLAPPSAPPGSVTTTTTTYDPMTGQVSQSREQTTVDPSGRQISQSDKYSAEGGVATHSSSTKVTRPDGSSATTTTKEWSGNPQ